MDIYNNQINNLQVTQIPSGSTAEIALPMNWSMCNSFIAGTGLQIPANMPLGRTTVGPYDLGNIGNPTSVLLGFYAPNWTAFDIQKTLPISPGVTSASIGSGISPGTSIVSEPPLGAMAPALLLVSQDYTATRKFWQPTSYSIGNSGGNTSTNNTTTNYSTGISGQTFLLPLGKSYADIGVGVLIGWYGVFPNSSQTSPFGLGVKNAIQFESAWLTQSGTDTYVTFSFFTVSGASSGAYYQLGIIR